MKSDSRIIAVSQRVIEIASYGETRDCLDQQWAVWLDSLDLTCVPVPNRLSSVPDFLRALRPAGIVLTGGNNLASDVYNQLSTNAVIGDAYQHRDETERAMIEYAVSESLPLLGCCRGMQMLHAFFGGRISPLGTARCTHVNQEHPIEIIEDSFRSLSDAESVIVNSYHDFGFEQDALPEQLLPFAVSLGDGVVEGVYHSDFPFVGIMWHPERENPAAAFDYAIASKLFLDRV